MSTLTLERKNFDQVAVVTINGRLDAHTAQQLLRLVRKQLEAGLPRIVLQGAHISFGSLSGVRTILQLQQEARAKGGELLLAAPSRPLGQVLALTETNRFVKMYPTLNEAIGSLFYGSYALC